MDTLSVALKVDVGSSTETEKERGIAHFAEHMAFDASRKQLRRYGVWLSLDAKGVKANAFTTHRTTVYEVNDGKSPGDFNDGKALSRRIEQRPSTKRCWSSS